APATSRSRRRRRPRTPARTPPPATPGTAGRPYPRRSRTPRIPMLRGRGRVFDARPRRQVPGRSAAASLVRSPRPATGRAAGGRDGVVGTVLHRPVLRRVDERGDRGPPPRARDVFPGVHDGERLVPERGGSFPWDVELAADVFGRGHLRLPRSEQPLARGFV